jgi:NADH-quinone oxidoreductase subunit N
VGAVASVIGAFYYLRVIKVMMFDAPSDVELADDVSWIERGLIASAALYVSVVGWPVAGLLGAATARAAGALI